MNKKKKFAGLLQIAQQEIEHTEVYIKEHIEILDELRELIRPLSAEELQQLEQNILAEGCRDPLVLWHDKQGQRYILVDGHHRYTICRRHRLPFKIEVRDFAHIEDVKDWMVNNQLGKRNLTREEMAYLRGYQYNRFKQKPGNLQNLRQFAETQVVSQNQGNTAQKLAAVYKVSDKTIKRDGQFAEGLDRLAKGMPGLKNRILKGEIKISAQSIRNVPKMSDEEVETLRKSLLIEKEEKNRPKKHKTSEKKHNEKLLALKQEIVQMLERIEDESLLVQVKTLLSKA